MYSHHVFSTKNWATLTENRTEYFILFFLFYFILFLWKKNLYYETTVLSREVTFWFLSNKMTKQIS